MFQEVGSSEVNEQVGWCCSASGVLRYARLCKDGLTCPEHSLPRSTSGTTQTQGTTKSGPSVQPGSDSKIAPDNPVVADFTGSKSLVFVPLPTSRVPAAGHAAGHAWAGHAWAHLTFAVAHHSSAAHQPQPLTLHIICIGLTCQPMLQTLGPRRLPSISDCQTGQLHAGCR